MEEQTLIALIAIKARQTEFSGLPTLAKHETLSLWHEPGKMILICISQAIAKWGKC